MSVIVSSPWKSGGALVGPSGGFTPGSVPFATAAGVLGQDNANLFWDNSSKRLGLGTNAPTSVLHVNTNDAQFGLLVAGTTKAVRFSTTATSASIAGTDRTGLVSFQTLSLTGSAIEFAINGAAVGGVDAAGALTMPAFVVSTSTLMSSSVALANGAGAAAGTLLNAPVAGNPTKWVSINDNGTTRYIPSW